MAYAVAGLDRLSVEILWKTAGGRRDRSETTELHLTVYASAGLLWQAGWDVLVWGLLSRG